MTPDAPAGVHPLVWLAIFLLVGPPALLSTWAGKRPGVLGAPSRWWRNRQRDGADSPAWQVSQAEKKRLMADYARIAEDYDALVARVDRMDEALTQEKTRSWAAYGYIRRLIDSRRRHAPDADIPQPPESLRDIFI